MLLVFLLASSGSSEASVSVQAASCRILSLCFVQHDIGRFCMKGSGVDGANHGFKRCRLDSPIWETDRGRGIDPRACDERSAAWPSWNRNDLNGFAAGLSMGSGKEHNDCGESRTKPCAGTLAALTTCRCNILYRLAGLRPTGVSPAPRAGRMDAND